MKMNISALMNLISEDEKKLNSKISTIKGLALSTSTEELDGRLNIIEDNKIIFTSDLNEIEKTIEELSKLKSILYKKNNTFKLSDGRSIQEAIIDNINLRKIKTIYEQLLLFKNSKKRVTEVNNSYFECKTTNFDAKDIKKKLEKVNEKIQNTDFEISKLNSIEFEI